jgi:hypothetical protein
VRGALADHREQKTISLLAIAVSHLEVPAIVQLELPLGLADEGRRPGTKKGLARSRADRAIDAIRKRFGGKAVDYGSAVQVVRSVPDEFRRLAERDLRFSPAQFEDVRAALVDGWALASPPHRRYSRVMHPPYQRTSDG